MVAGSGSIDRSGTRGLVELVPQDEIGFPRSRWGGDCVRIVGGGVEFAHDDGYGVLGDGAAAHVDRPRDQVVTAVEGYASAASGVGACAEVASLGLDRAVVVYASPCKSEGTAGTASTSVVGIGRNAAVG